MRVSKQGRRNRPLATGLVALMTALLLGTAMTVTVNADSFKPYSLDNIPTSVAPGTPYSITVTDLATTQALGSMQITVPTGFVIDSASVNSASSSNESFSISANRLTVIYQNLNLSPQGQAVVGLTFRAIPCNSGSAVLQWNFQAQQANQWNSSNNANYMTLAAWSFTGGVRVDGSGDGTSPSTVLPYSNAYYPCTLQFLSSSGTAVADAQVASTGNLSPDTRILSQNTPASGTPVQVSLTGPNGPIAGAAIQVALNDANGNATNVALNGTTTQITSLSGIAAFGNLTVGTVSLAGYTLRASFAGASDALSNQFSVSQTVTICTSSACTSTTTDTSSTINKGSQFTTQGSTSTPGAYISSALNPAAILITCDFAPFNYPDSRQPDTYFFNYSATSAKTVTIVINKNLVQQTPNNGASSYQVCLAAPHEFLTRAVTNVGPDGAYLLGGMYAVESNAAYSNLNFTPAAGVLSPSTYFGKSWYVGLLPDCSSTVTTECLASRTGSGAGNRTLVSNLSSGDPALH